MNSTHAIIEYFVAQGVPLETVSLLLVLPVIATMIAFFRQVLGMKAFGIYTPLIVTFAFLATGIKYGIALFVIVILVGMVSRVLLRKLRILYLPRVAITLTIVAFVILALLVAGGAMKRTGLAAVSIFPLLIMITLVEKFVATQIEKGNQTALILALETMIISAVGYYLASWEMLKEFIIVYPWAILLTLPINILLGKWTGLRLSEYLRFREVLKRIT
ncbi:hypothetical protein EPO05_04615 [Patescibacteria group bacterium]|nr:MAG: hypothetical protein EPO05_04615 [Patescibacteria group bacterium]